MSMVKCAISNEIHRILFVLFNDNQGTSYWENPHILSTANQKSLRITATDDIPFTGKDTTKIQWLELLSNMLQIYTYKNNKLCLHYIYVYINYKEMNF
jgi:hypothetical protein